MGLAVERAAVGQRGNPAPARAPGSPASHRPRGRSHVGRIEVEPDDVGGLGSELGNARETPGFAPGEVDPLRPPKAPNVLIADVTEFLGERRRGPAREALRAAAGRAAPGMRRAAAAPVQVLGLPERGTSVRLTERPLAVGPMRSAPCSCAQCMRTLPSATKRRSRFRAPWRTPQECSNQAFDPAIPAMGVSVEPSADPELRIAPD